MFHSAALKLTTWYLAIIMSVSIIFSLALYSVSRVDLDHNVNRQLSYFNGFLSPYDLNNYSQIRQQQTSQDKAHLRARLISLNLLVLVLGGLASYGLARRTLEPIEESLEAQKRFAADASHELRTPLAAMQAEIEVALRSPKLSKAEAIDQLKSNLEEVAKLKNLSESLLKLASTGNSSSLKQAVDLKSVISQAVQRLDKTAQAKQIVIKTNVTDASTVGDHDNLVDLVAILLDNAIKYSSDGSQLVISAHASAKQCLIKVSDHGQGIAAADLPHIFDRFYRADASRTKNQTEGYGLGLALASKIAEAHAGHIEVKSMLSKGSTFSVYLPLAVLS